MLVGHNFKFDFDFLDVFLEKNLNVKNWSQIICRNRTRDTKEIVKFCIDLGFFGNLKSSSADQVLNYIKEGPEGKRLVNLEIYGQAHTALYDAIFATELYNICLELIEKRMSGE